MDDAQLTAAQAAEREAYEEAGLVGRIYGEDAVGRYQYEKQFDGGDTRIRQGGILTR